MSKKNFFGMKKYKWLLGAWVPVIMIMLCSPFFPRDDINFEQIGITNGLSQNTVCTILQDSRGFLWFGTEDGLNRYDGYMFKVYKNNPDDPGSLNSNWIRSLYEDEWENIWVGTQGGGLNRYDRYTEKFVHYVHDPSNPNSLSDDTVWSICGDGTGALWLGTDNGLNRFIPGTGEFTRWLQEPVKPGESGHIVVKTIISEKPGVLWIGTLGSGLYRFAAGKLSHYLNEPNTPNNLNNNKIRAIYINPSGFLWVGTNEGLYKFDKRRGTFSNYTKKYNHFLSPGVPITSLTGEKDSNILSIGTYGNGLYRLDQKTGTISHDQPIPCNPTSLSSNYIQVIYEDNNEIVWVGTDSGLNKFDKKKQKFVHWGMQLEDMSSLSNKSVWSIYKDREDIIWVGTEGGLDRLDRKNNTCSRFQINDKSLRLDNKKIMSILEDRNGNLWIGTDKDGLYRIDRMTKTAAHFQPNSLGTRINVIYETKSGKLWLGTTEGLNKFAPLTETFTCYKNLDGKENSLSHNYVNVIYEDYSNALWIGTKDGLNLLLPGKETFTHWHADRNNPQGLSNENISCLCETKPGIFWIGTWGGGLNKFNRAKGTFEQYLEKDGLPNNVIYCILNDKHGNLWMSTNKGITKFNPEDKTFKNYDAGDGLQSNEFNAGAFYKSKDHEMFFGGIDGFNSFYPGNIIDNSHIPPIVITDFQVFSESNMINARSRLNQSITETKVIRLSYQDIVFSFDFAALDFSNPQKNKYAYKMEGFDRDWNLRDSTRRFATYTNLDHGRYVFRVKGSNNDGVWNENGTAITIIIVPPFWKTWWFRSLLFTAFAILSYFIINFIKQYIRFSGFWKTEKYIGKFKLLERIGSGGMGTIYKAEDTIEKSGLVALKVLREELFPDENHQQRFKREAAIIDQLDHPNIVKVFERGRHQEKLYIAMEYLEGKTLATKIAEEEKIDLKEILDIIFQIACALKKIHGKQIVHRDLKPENVMLIEKDGKSNFVKLLDFGLAKDVNHSKITQSGMVLGTVNYMAPEQISHGDCSLATDIYSLGVIFYEMVTGRIPFPGGKMTQIMGKILCETPMEPIHLRSDLPSECNKLINWMMEKDHILRPTVSEVLADLDKIRAANS